MSELDKAIELIQNNKHYINNMLIEDNYLEAIDLIIKKGGEMSTRISELETALIDEDRKHREEILKFKGQTYYCQECVNKDKQIALLKEEK